MQKDQLIHGNFLCVDGLDAGSIQLAIADPPYNIGFDYHDELKDDHPPDEYLAWSARWLQRIHTLLTRNGAFWLFIGDEFVSELDVLAKRIGFHKRQHVVWYYTFGVNSAKKFTRSHCHVLHYVVNPKDFIFDATAVRVASARETVYGDARAAADGRLPDDTWIIRPAPGLFPEDADTWCASRICGTFAQRRAVPNQLPEQLIGRIVRTCSLPGDTVLDPMCGSGTVPTVAKKLGRSYIGVEQSKKFMAIAAQRVQQATVGAALT